MPNFKSTSFKMAVLRGEGGGADACVIQKTTCGIGLNKKYFREPQKGCCSCRYPTQRFSSNSGKPSLMTYHS